MTLKQLLAPHLGPNLTVKMGRRRPIAHGPRLFLRDYLRLSFPPAPASCDYGSPAASVLANIYGNDQLGDCVIAGGYHVTGIETGNAGDLFTASDAQIIKDYSAIGGYVPGDASTDQGCQLTDALNYWTQHGFANGTKLLGWLAIDASNKAEVQAACYLFENLYLGMELPDAWVSPMPSGSGFTWDKAGAPDPSNGHCVMAYGYDGSGLKIDTWGMLGTMTWAAVLAYLTAHAQGELYVMLTPDQLTKGQTRAPNGVDWSQLVTDFDAMGGSVPVPTPSPPAPPTPPAPPAPPTPTGVTLAQAEAWANQGLKAAHAIMTRGQAEKAVATALAKNWPKP